MSHRGSDAIGQKESLFQIGTQQNAAQFAGAYYG
jgi:hypothetical protein